MFLIFLIIFFQFDKICLGKSSHNQENDFRHRRSAPICCECVQFFQCMNGVINTDGVGLISVRHGGPKTTELPPAINVEVCPDPLYVCCQVPDADPTCELGNYSKEVSTTTDNPEFIAPHPDSSCECISHKDCYPELVVSNGLGITTIELENGRKVSHSKCSHSLDVCCYLFDILDISGIEGTTEEECECVERVLCGPDGRIDASGIGVINVRLGPSNPPKACPYDPSLVCCLPAKHDVSTETTGIVPVQEICECVYPELCGPDGYIITDGEGAINVRLGPIRKACPSDRNKVCCLPPKVVVPAPNSVSTMSPVSEICECVFPELCSPDGYIITDGAGTINVRLGATHKPCPIDPNKVCCRPPKDFSTPTTLTTQPFEQCECVDSRICGPDGRIQTGGSLSINPRLGPFKPPKICANRTLVCCLPPIIEATTKLPKIQQVPCGTRNSQGIGVRVLGFQAGQTQFGEFPWVVALLRRENLFNNDSYFFQGGASLINSRVVLTAAHKVYGKKAYELIARVGEWDSTSEKESLPHQDIEVEEVFIHPDYKPGPLFHDVALVILKKNAHLDYHIQPICIAQSYAEVDSSSCVVNGWGVDNFENGRYEKVMKSVLLPLVDRRRCEGLLRRTRLSKYFRLHHSFTCAGGQEGVDACKGDGGGPLSCQLKNDSSRHVQVGITAWGVGCGTKDVPGVYVDIPVHYEWIQSVAKQYSLQTENQNKRNRNNRNRKNRNRNNRRNRNRNNRRSQNRNNRGNQDRRRRNQNREN